MRTHLLQIQGRPSMTTRGRVITGRGSFLLNRGGAGDGSSYDGIDSYLATTETQKMKGSGASLNRKLEALSFLPKPPLKKMKNIKFNL